MESIIALQGADYVVIAADVSSARSVVVMKDDMDKIRVLDSHKLFAAAGVPGDVCKFSEHVQKDVRLYNMRSGITMSTAAVANYTRGELARFLRKSPYQCNVLIGGYDEGNGSGNGQGQGASLYSCDYLGTLHRLSFAAEGYAQYFVLSTLDRYWRKGMGVDEGVDVVKRCIREVQKRLVINQPRFVIKVVGKDGVRVVQAAEAGTGDVDMGVAAQAATA